MGTSLSRNTPLLGLFSRTMPQHFDLLATGGIPTDVCWPHFEPSLGAVSLGSDVIRSIEMISSSLWAEYVPAEEEEPRHLGNTVSSFFFITLKPRVE